MSNKDYLKPLNKRCQTCEREFTTLWIRQLYCCKPCYMAGLKKNNDEWRKRVGSPVYNRKRTQNERDLRVDAITILGGKCKHCGYSDIRALHIDHVYSDGKDERTTRKKINRGIVRGTVDRSRYQILCANCNWIKRLEKNEGTNREDLNSFLLEVNLKNGNKQ